MPVVAMSCHNLSKVAKDLREQYPAADLVVLADLGSSEVHAERAAREVGARLATPTFADEARIDGARPTDFNDLAQLSGRDVVAATIARATLPADGSADMADLTASGSICDPSLECPSAQLSPPVAAQTDAAVGFAGTPMVTETPETPVLEPFDPKACISKVVESVTYERRSDGSVLYRVAGRDAYIDYGQQILMVPTAKEDEEAIPAGRRADHAIRAVLPP